ncbi:hypothetical protein MRB53_019217 [Persea americana]|uniref:Uncharacterized protein n=1 Tax=Persea americana TaxID=3435 RepID=A0ACC2KY08_PERAE|nr:hypothetical protein MRB53_019217 [Persea americana]
MKIVALRETRGTRGTHLVERGNFAAWVKFELCQVEFSEEQKKFNILNYSIQCYHLENGCRQNHDAEYTPV